MAGDGLLWPDEESDPQRPAEEEADAELREVTVPAAQHQARLDKALAELVPEFSRSYLQQLLAQGDVRLNGQPAAKPAHKVRAGDQVAVRMRPTQQSQAFKPESLPLDVVHEDEHLLVIDKPAGLVVHPAPGNWSGTLLNALLGRDAQAMQVPRAGIVHRLDKDTSGLLVVAKTLAAHTDLVRQLQARTVKREYLALVYGEIDRAGTVDAPLARDPHNRTRRGVHPLGKPAVTHYEPVERFPGGITLLRCILETGRTHQIRVHLQHIGHPLVGEPVYSASRRGHLKIPFPRQALHAERLGLIHPVTRDYVQWESPLPPDFASLLQALRDNTDWAK